jgi:hypothetical protein
VPSEPPASSGIKAQHGSALAVEAGLFVLLAQCFSCSLKTGCCLLSGLLFFKASLMRSGLNTEEAGQLRITGIEQANQSQVLADGVGVDGLAILPAGRDATSFDDAGFQLQGFCFDALCLSVGSFNLLIK